MAIKKNESLPFAATWMALEGIMLIEISQTERQILDDIISMRNLKNYNKLGSITKKKQTQGHREQTCGCQGGAGGGIN